MNLFKRLWSRYRSPISKATSVKNLTVRPTLEFLEGRINPVVGINFNGNTLAVSIAGEQVAHAVQFLTTATAGVTDLQIDGVDYGTFAATTLTFQDQALPGEYTNASGDFVYNGTTTPLIATTHTYGGRIVSLAANSSLTGTADHTTLQDFAAGCSIIDTGSYSDTLLAGKNATIVIGTAGVETGGSNEVYATAPGCTLTLYTHVGGDIVMTNAANTVVDASPANTLLAPFFPTNAAAGSGGFVVTPSADGSYVTDFYAAPATGTASLTMVNAGPNVVVTWIDVNGMHSITQPRSGAGQLRFLTAFGGGGSLTAINTTSIDSAFYGSSAGGNDLEATGPDFALFKAIGPGTKIVAGAYRVNDVYLSPKSGAADSVSFGTVIAQGYNQLHQLNPAQAVNISGDFDAADDVWTGSTPLPPGGYLPMVDAWLVVDILAGQKTA